LVIFFVVLALTAGAFGALGLPRLAVVAPPEQWSLAASTAEVPTPAPARPHRCRHEREHVTPLPFDYAR
jgi:hypothetical protein